MKTVLESRDDCYKCQNLSQSRGGTIKGKVFICFGQCQGKN